jgi:hypothetical protein
MKSALPIYFSDVSAANFSKSAKDAKLNELEFPLQDSGGAATHCT